MSHIVVTHSMPQTPASAVWEAITDLGGLAVWNRSCAKSAWIGEPKGLGGRARLSMYDGTELIEEITAHEPDAGRHAFTVEGVPGPLATMAGEMTVRSVGDGCELTFESEYTLKGGIFGAAIDLLVLRAAIRREHRKILADLEHHLSTGDAIGKGGVRTPASVRTAA